MATYESVLIKTDSYEIKTYLERKYITQDVDDVYAGTLEDGRISIRNRMGRTHDDLIELTKKIPDQDVTTTMYLESEHYNRAHIKGYRNGKKRDIDIIEVQTED